MRILVALFYNSIGYLKLKGLVKLTFILRVSTLFYYKSRSAFIAL